MELKTIIAIGLVVFIIGGLIFLKVRSRKEIPGITVPNIRAVLCVQNKVLADRNKVRSGRLVEELLREAGESRCGHE